MRKERLEEIKELLDGIGDEVNLVHKAKLKSQVRKAFKEQAERVEELENRNKELEYASKYNGELNEFLQKRKLPASTLGRHVVDVVMDYVGKLEQQNKQYRESIKNARDELGRQTGTYEAPTNITPEGAYVIYEILQSALESE